MRPDVLRLLACAVLAQALLVPAARGQSYLKLAVMDLSAYNKNFSENIQRGHHPGVP